jgi:hypothetical protein
MKKNLLMSILVATVAATALADTFVVPADKGTSSDEPQLAASHGAGSCMYADKPIKLGDTVIVMGESRIVLVCANASHGPVFYPLSSAGAAQVVKATAKRNR